MVFFVEKKIENAHFINKKFYLDDRVFNKSIKNIFLNNPIYILHKSTLKQTKELIPKKLYPNVINEEVILNTSNHDIKNIISNTCTHRGHTILDESCNKRIIQCPYHGRTFDNEGNLRSAPGFEQNIKKLKETENLKSYSYFKFLNFYFLNNSQSKIKNYVDEYSNLFDWYPFEKLKPEKNHIKEYIINAHWALYIENYLEGLHIPYIHKDLVKEIDLKNYYIKVLSKAVLQIAKGKSTKNTFTKFKSCPLNLKSSSAFYLWIYPNIMINIYTWGISLNIIEPVNKEKTLIHYETYVLKNTTKKQGAGGNLNKIEIEDQNAILKVQKGLKSSSYIPGKISAIHEKGIHHFHKLLCEDLNN